MNYLQRKKLAFMSIVNKVKGFVREVSGIPPLLLENCVDSDSLIDYKLYGNSFQDGTPSPENSIPVVSVGEYDSETGKYKIPVTARGKNLFDEELLLNDKYVTKVDSGYEFSNYAISYSSSTALTKHLKNVLKANTTYTLSRKINNYISDSTGAIAISTNSFGVIKLYQGGGIVSKTFSLTQEQIDDITKVLIYGPPNTTSDTVIFNYIQLETGDVATDYEPYREPIITNLYLDEPLRKVGDYADYVDFGKGEVVRKVKEVEFSGSENWYNYPNGKGFHPGGLPSMKIQTSGKGLCNYFTAINNINLVGIRYGANNNIMYFCQVYTDENPLTVNGWKTKLTELKEAGTPVKVTYILAEPTHTPISIPKLPIIKGTTIYEIGTSLNASGMEATYYSTVKGE